MQIVNLVLIKTIYGHNEALSFICVAVCEMFELRVRNVGQWQSRAMAPPPASPSPSPCHHTSAGGTSSSFPAHLLIKNWHQFLSRFVWGRKLKSEAKALSQSPLLLCCRDSINGCYFTVLSAPQLLTRRRAVALEAWNGLGWKGP